MRPFRKSLEGSRSSQSDPEEEDFGDELAVLLSQQHRHSPVLDSTKERYDDDDDEGDSGDSGEDSREERRRRSHSSHTSISLPSLHFRPSPCSGSSSRRGGGGARSPFPRWTRATAIPLSRSTFLCLILSTLLTGTFIIYYLIQFLLLRHSAYSHSVFSPPLIPNPIPLEPLVPPFDTHPAPAAIQNELDTRLYSLDLSLPHLPCPFSKSDSLRYSYLREPSQGPYFFALNLWNNELVLPTLARTLLSLADFLGKDKVHISIFENGSTDNTTNALAHFAAALTHQGVPHTIVGDRRKTDWKRVDRIAQLSVYRSVALEPLLASNSTGKTPYQDIIFMNDVYVCPKDALELLHQKRWQEADAACAMDWRETKDWFGGWLGKGSVKFYDNSPTHTLFLSPHSQVSRTVTGDMFRSRFDVFAEMRDGVEELFDQPGSEPTRDRFRAGRPFPVYSCWNGMLALHAAPFMGDPEQTIKFRSALNSPGECAASECKTVARDFWAKGFKRWLVVPSVRVSYAEKVYTHPALLSLSSKSTTESTIPERIDWGNTTEPDDVVCYAWARGFHVDLPSRRTREKPYRR